MIFGVNLYKAKEIELMLLGRKGLKPWAKKVLGFTQEQIQTGTDRV